MLNRRGYERLLATGRLDEVGIVVPGTDSFGQRNQGMSVREGLAMATGILKDAHRKGIPAQATITVAFGCPFEGPVPAHQIMEIARALAAEGPVELALADTIGVGVPVQVRALFQGLKDVVGDELPMRAHFHDTRNMGIANAAAALEAGVATLDASIGGIGGCPFAPDATGNIATEDLVYLLDHSGLSHGLDLEQLIQAADWLEGVLGKEVPSALLRAGDFIPSPASASGES